MQATQKYLSVRLVRPAATGGPVEGLFSRQTATDCGLFRLGNICGPALPGDPCVVATKAVAGQLLIDTTNGPWSLLILIPPSHRSIDAARDICDLITWGRRIVKLLMVLLEEVLPHNGQLQMLVLLWPPR
jgi:hypothetical protein